MKSFYQYGNVLLLDHETELAEISTNITKMKQSETNYLELMDNNNDVIRFNVNKFFLFLFLNVQPTLMIVYNLFFFTKIINLADKQANKPGIL